LRAPLKVNNVFNDIQNDKTIKATKQNLDQKLLGKLKTIKQTWHTKPGETSGLKIFLNGLYVHKI